MLSSSVLIPIQAAPISLVSIPASACASRNASTIRSSAPESQRSPNSVHPMPMMATRSRIPLAMSRALLPRRRLPEVPAIPTLVVEVLDAKHHPQRHTDFELLAVGIFHHEPRAHVELNMA